MPKSPLIHNVRNLIRPPRIAPGFVVFVAGYAAIVFWFKEVDVYHKEFSTPGLLTAAYNLCRVLYIFYLFWIVYQVGNFLLTCVAKDSWRAVGGVERIAIGFFAGTGLCHAILLLLGYLDLYTVPIAIIITVPLVAFAYRDAAALFATTRLAIADWYAPRNAQAWLFGLAVATALAAAVALLLVKGLYPAGGHDYFLHYFSYYKSVIDRGGIWPTAYYVHGYDSKGDGLVFLSMLLTDSIAHQLVTFCFIVAGALALHQFLSRIAPATLWPLVGVILYLSLYIYTPGTGMYLSNGGWGDFEKWHEFMTALTIAILWLVAGGFEAVGGIRLLRASAAGSAVIAAAIIDYTFSIYLGLVFTLLAAICLAFRRWRDGWTCMALAATAGAVLTVMIATNYLTTGLFGDIAITSWWRFTDVDRLYRAGTLLQAINDYWSRIPLQPNAALFSYGTLKLIFLSLRLELLYPLVASGVGAAVLAVVMGRSSRPPQNQATVLIAAGLAYLIVALVLGRNGSQEISFYRYSSFTLPIVIAVAVTLWSMVYVSAGAGLMRATLHLLVPVAVLAGCWSAAFAAYPKRHFSQILANAARFAVGQTSIDEAYTDQRQWPGRLPWGGIYPGARGAYAVVGPHVRIWSFDSHAYCMLPDCDIDVFFYGPMTGEDERVFFGSPEEARRALQKAGLNYFLISSELNISDPMASPLFAPSNIAKYLGLRWTDGTTSLLTWLGPNTTPLSPTWLATYCRVVGRGSGLYYGAMRKVFADLHARPHPWGRLDLPWAGDRPFQSVEETGPPFLQSPCPPFPIEIVSATYGESCGGFSPKAPAENSVREGNVTSFVQKACQDHKPEVNTCTFQVDGTRWGEPGPGCSKDFSVTYRCEPNGPPRIAITPAPASGETVHLDCAAPPPSGLTIRSATYGGNCGAEPGNSTRQLASICNGEAECTYSVDRTQLGDAAPTCSKDENIVASYSCAPDTTVLRKESRAEPGSDAMLQLSCLPEPSYDTAALPHVASGQSLDFSNGKNARAFFSGWSAPEPSGVWSATNAAYLGFVVDGIAAPKQITLHAVPWLVPGRLDDQRVQVWSAGKKLAEYDLNVPSPPDLEIPLTDIAVAGGKPVILGFYFPDARPASQTTMTTDGRKLGLQLMSLQLSP
jgi:hypothetical protein